MEGRRGAGGGGAGGCHTIVIYTCTRMLLHGTTPHNIALYHTAPYCTAPHRTTPHHTAPHHTAPHHTALHSKPHHSMRHMSHLNEGNKFETKLENSVFFKLAIFDNHIRNHLKLHLLYFGPHYSIWHMLHLNKATIHLSFQLIFLRFLLPSYSCQSSFDPSTCTSWPPPPAPGGGSA